MDERTEELLRRKLEREEWSGKAGAGCVAVGCLLPLLILILSAILGAMGG